MINYLEIDLKILDEKKNEKMKIYGDALTHIIINTFRHRYHEMFSDKNSKPTLSKIIEFVSLIEKNNKTIQYFNQISSINKIDYQTEIFPKFNIEKEYKSFIKLLENYNGKNEEKIIKKLGFVLIKYNEILIAMNKTQI